MIRTRLFTRNGCQAVQLPKVMAFPDGVRDVVVLRDGVRRVIVPTESAWDDFFSAPGIDLAPREQPEVRDRETVDG